MKKTLLIILSLILCISMLTGCAESIIEGLGDAVQSDSEQPTQAPETDNGDVVVDHANMQVAIDSFNKIDLSALGEIPFDYFGTVKELLSKLSFSLDTDISGVVNGEEGDASIVVKMNDSKLYFDIDSKGVEDDEAEKIEAFLALTENNFDTYANFGDGWQKHVQDLEEIMGQAPSVDPEMVNGLIEDIVIPKLEEKYLTKKDDMLLLSNDYIIDLVVANVPVITELTGQEIGDEEIEGFKTMVKEFFEEYGIAIYLGTGAETITKLAVEMKDEENSIYGEIALTDDASALDHFTLKVKTEFGGKDLKYAPETVINAKSVYDDEGNAVGLDVDATLYVSGSSYGEYEEVSENEEKYTRESAIQKATIDAILDFGAIGKTNADIFNLDVDVETVKVIKTETLKNWETGEETLLSVTEGDLSEYDEKFDLLINLKSETENKITFKFDVNEGDYNTSAVGTLEMSDNALDFDFKVTEDKKEIFSIDASVSSEDDKTINFSADLTMGEDEINISGELYIGEDVVLPAFPTDYEDVENNPLFGSTSEELPAEKVEVIG